MADEPHLQGTTAPPDVANPDTGVSVGLVVAAAMVPGTFARSLSSRSAIDQGLVTGLSAGLHYLLTVGAQDALHAAVAEARAKDLDSPAVTSVRRTRLLHLASDLAMIPLGVAVARALPSHPDEPMLRGAVRQLSWRFAVTGFGGSLLLVTQAALRRADDRLGAGGRVASLPVAIPIGLGIALVRERRRQIDRDTEYAALSAQDSSDPGLAEARATDPALRDSGSASAATELTPSKVRSLGAAGAVVGSLALVAYSEHLAATEIGRALSARLPGGQQLWKLAGHAVALGGLGGVALNAYGQAMRKVEAGTSTHIPLIEADESTRWAGPNVSGGPGSLVRWEDLGREGRRHALTFVRPEPLDARPPGAPELSIQTVMGEPAKATPTRIYISLDAAPTIPERVDLALAEMDRTGAFDRSLLMLVSPTGTGYVNYVASAAAEYLTLGDIATVTMQYSRRPSPLSLGKVKDARAQNRLLWLRILERLHKLPEPRPRVVVFGESLGAHTSQDVFLHWGTMGPRALGIDRALWVGTPYISKWMREITGQHRLDVDPDCLAVVNDFDQVVALGEQRRAKLRYVLVSHDNDGVTKFGPDLLATTPRWLGPDRPAPASVPGASPRGIPAEMRWRPLTTFFQSLIDMKNAQVPGEFRAWAHDYRADLVRFVSEVYDLEATADQLAAVEAAVRDREAYREELFSR